MSNFTGLESIRHGGLVGARRAALHLFVLVLSLGGLSSCVTKSVLPPSASEIAVTFQLAPPAAVQTGSQISLMVNVVNDVTDAGVDWVAS